MPYTDLLNKRFGSGELNLELKQKTELEGKEAERRAARESAEAIQEFTTQKLAANCSKPLSSNSTSLSTDRTTGRPKLGDYKNFFRAKMAATNDNSLAPAVHCSTLSDTPISTSNYLYDPTLQQPIAPNLVPLSSQQNFSANAPSPHTIQSELCYNSTLNQFANLSTTSSSSIAPVLHSRQFPLQQQLAQNIHANAQPAPNMLRHHSESISTPNQFSNLSMASVPPSQTTSVSHQFDAQRQQLSQSGPGYVQPITNVQQQSIYQQQQLIPNHNQFGSLSATPPVIPISHPQQLLQNGLGIAHPNVSVPQQQFSHFQPQQQQQASNFNQFSNLSTASLSTAAVSHQFDTSKQQLSQNGFDNARPTANVSQQQRYQQQQQISSQQQNPNQYAPSLVPPNNPYSFVTTVQQHNVVSPALLAEQSSLSAEFSRAIQQQIQPNSNVQSSTTVSNSSNSQYPSHNTTNQFFNNTIQHPQPTYNFAPFSTANTPQASSVQNCVLPSTKFPTYPNQRCENSTLPLTPSIMEQQPQQPMNSNSPFIPKAVSPWHQNMSTMNPYGSTLQFSNIPSSKNNSNFNSTIN